MAAARTTSSGAAYLRTGKAVSRRRAPQSLREGDVAVLGRDIIHSVTNPLDKVSYAIHVYDGDFLSAEGRSCWDAETLCEMPYDADAVSPAFRHALTSR